MVCEDEQGKYDRCFLWGPQGQRARVLLVSRNEGMESSTPALPASGQYDHTCSTGVGKVTARHGRLLVQKLKKNKKVDARSAIKMDHF